MGNIQLRDVNKSFGATVIIPKINLDIENGEFVVFVGPSGCGKSTMMRMIAGLEEISAGDILIGDQVINQVPGSPVRVQIRAVLSTEYVRIELPSGENAPPITRSVWPFNFSGGPPRRSQTPTAFSSVIPRM